MNNGDPETRRHPALAVKIFADDNNDFFPEGQNILFADGHVKWYQGFAASEMTFRYNSMSGGE